MSAFIKVVAQWYLILALIFSSFSAALAVWTDPCADDGRTGHTIGAFFLWPIILPSVFIIQTMRPDIARKVCKK